MSGKSTPITKAQFADLCAAFTGKYAERNVLMVSLGYYFGGRIAEIVSLTIADVTDGSGQVNGHIVAQRCNQKNGKNGKATGRIIAINLALKELLQNYLKTRKDVRPDMPLLPSEQAGRFLRPEAASLIFKRAANKAGLDRTVSTHSLRKTFAHNVLKNGANNVMVVRDALGHTNVATTMAYLNVSQVEVDAAVMGIR